MSGESSSEITYIMRTLAVTTFSVFCRLDTRCKNTKGILRNYSPKNFELERIYCHGSPKTKTLLFYSEVSIRYGGNRNLSKRTQFCKVFWPNYELINSYLVVIVLMGTYIYL